MKRTRHEIRADILRIAFTGALKTEIVYGANLNFMLLKRHLGALIATDRIRKEGRFYTTTGKGFKYITDVEALI